MGQSKYPLNDPIAFAILAVSAIILSSWGLVWARWDVFYPISHFINLHAILISAAGMGLQCSLGIINSLMKRIEALENTVNQVKRER